MYLIKSLDFQQKIQRRNVLFDFHCQLVEMGRNLFIQLQPLFHWIQIISHFPFTGPFFIEFEEILLIFCQLGHIFQKENPALQTVLLWLT